MHMSIFFNALPVEKLMLGIHFAICNQGLCCLLGLGIAKHELLRPGITMHFTKLPVWEGFGKGVDCCARKKLR